MFSSQWWALIWPRNHHGQLKTLTREITIFACHLFFSFSSSSCCILITGLSDSILFDFITQILFLRAKNIQLLELAEITKLLKKMHDSTVKSAIMMTDIEYNVLRSHSEYPPMVMEEKIPFASMAVCTRSFNFANQLVVEVMMKLMPTGIPQYLYKYLMEFEFRPLVAPPVEPIVFSLTDLEFGFIVWLIAVGVCITAFFLELLWYSLYRKLVKIVKDWIGLYLLLKYFTFAL